MSWLKPGNITSSEYDPSESVENMSKRHGRLSQLVLQAFNEIDPLHVFYGENVDEYLNYVERFMSQLGDRGLTNLNDQEIIELVRGSFHKSQIEKGFADSKDLKELSQRIIQLRDDLKERPLS